MLCNTFCWKLLLLKYFSKYPEFLTATSSNWLHAAPARKSQCSRRKWRHCVYVRVRPDDSWMQQCKWGVISTSCTWSVNNRNNNKRRVHACHLPPHLGASHHAVLLASSVNQTQHNVNFWILIPDLGGNAILFPDPKISFRILLATS